MITLNLSEKPLLDSNLMLHGVIRQNYFPFNKCDFISTTYCTYRLRALPLHFSKHCGNGKKWQVAMSLSHRHLVVVVLPQPMDLLPRLH